MTTEPLTRQQARVLTLIHDWVGREGVPPSRDEIARAMGFASANGAKCHLLALERKGYLALLADRRRGIRLLDAGAQAIARGNELPLVGRIAAGSPVTAETNVDTWVKVDPALFRPRAHFLHRVAGHSMRDADIHDGDLVGIHAQGEAVNGQIVAAVLPDRKTGDETITLKRYYRRGSKVILKPENPSFKPIEIDLPAVDSETQEEIQDAPVFRIAGIFAGLIRVPR